jgi:hypothetical protein
MKIHFFLLIEYVFIDYSIALVDEIIFRLNLYLNETKLKPSEIVQMMMQMHQRYQVN